MAHHTCAEYPSPKSRDYCQDYWSYGEVVEKFDFRLEALLSPLTLFLQLRGEIFKTVMGSMEYDLIAKMGGSVRTDID